ncbi:hypothetical protein, partial [Candidatus Pyrohabitans sp.]
VMGALILIAAIGAAAYFLGSPNKEPGKGASPQDISSAAPQQDNTLLPTDEELPEELVKFIQEQRENDPLLKYRYLDITEPIAALCWKKEVEYAKEGIGLLGGKPNKELMILNAKDCTTSILETIGYLVDPTKPPTNYTGSLEDFKLPENYKQMRKQIIEEWKEAENDLYQCVKEVTGKEKIRIIIDFGPRQIPPEVGGEDVRVFGDKPETIGFIYVFGDLDSGTGVDIDRFFKEYNGQCSEEFKKLDDLTKKYGCGIGVEENIYSRYCIQRTIYEARKEISENPEGWRDFVPEYRNS